MDDRFDDSRYFGPRDQYQAPSPRSAGDHYSSAREYAAAGELGRGRSPRGGYGSPSQGYGSGGYGNDWDRGSRGGYRPERSNWDSPRYDRGYASQDRGGYQDRASYERDRGFFERAGDEVRSWFGDSEAERRREADMRYDARQAQDDDHYTGWRRERIAELDNDYDEYRRENAQRFHSEFNSWRTDRQGQRDGLRRVSEHMEVVGSDGEHVGKVDKVRGDRILLTRNDSDAGGHHHSIPSRWIQSVDDKVTLRKTAAEAQAAWKDEERGALFGGRDDQDWNRDRNLNRSFSGTY